MSQVTCDYFTRKADAKVFAVKIEDGRPLAAVGPLEAGEVGENPVAHDFRRQGKPASHWNLARDFIARGRRWVRYGAQLRQQPKTAFSATKPTSSRQASNRVFAPGFILPGR